MATTRRMTARGVARRLELLAASLRSGKRRLALFERSALKGIESLVIEVALPMATRVARLHCSQCGGHFFDRACGPTHALKAAELHSTKRGR